LDKHIDVPSLPTKNRSGTEDYSKLRRRYLENPFYERVLVYVSDSGPMPLREIQDNFKNLGADVTNILIDLVDLKYLKSSDNIYFKNEEIDPKEFYKINYDEFGDEFRLECSSNIIMNCAKEFGNDKEDYFTRHTVYVSPGDLRQFYQDKKELTEKFIRNSSKVNPSQTDRFVELYSMGINLRPSGGKNV